MWLWRIGSLLQAKSATLSGRLESAGTAGRTGRGRGIWSVPSFGFSLALSSPPCCSTRVRLQHSFVKMGEDEKTLKRYPKKNIPDQAKKKIENLGAQIR